MKKIYIILISIILIILFLGCYNCVYADLIVEHDYFDSLRNKAYVFNNANNSNTIKNENTYNSVNKIVDNTNTSNDRKNNGENRPLPTLLISGGIVLAIIGISGLILVKSKK